MEQQKNDRPLVEVRHLKKYFPIPGKGQLHAVDDVSFTINRGETLGLVGESGCGKSTVGNVLLQLHDRTDGEMYLDGEDVFAHKATHHDFCKKIQMIFQDPYSSLNPRKTVKDILSEPYLIHKIAKKGPELNKLLEDLCETVGLSHDLLNHYPHELDGGMRQVVGIARALSLDPSFIVCDEPVSALDVSVQAKIINLLMDLQKERQLQCRAPYLQPHRRHVPGPDRGDGRHRRDLRQRPAPLHHRSAQRHPQGQPPEGRPHRA